MKRLLFAAGALMQAACAQTSPGAYGATSDAAAPSDANAEAATMTANRGPATLALEGDANGLWWDDAAQALFIADNQNNRLLRYTDADGISKVVDLPAAPSQGPGLGQLARLADGTFLVTRFGFGVNGDVVLVKPDGTSSVLPNLDKTRRRIGVAVAPDGTLFDSYFVKSGSGDVGAVATLTLAGAETPIVTGLKKPVGLAVIAGSLFMSDQDQNQLLVAPLPTPAGFTVLAALPNADLICAGPAGSILSGGSDGNVRQVTADGKTSVLFGGFQSARGVAYDKTNGRLFIADHGASNTIQIRPIP